MPEPSSAIHDRLFRTIILGLGAVIAYSEIRIQLLLDEVNRLKDQLHEHTSKPAHEGATATSDLLRDLVFWLMNQIGIESFPASLAATIGP